MMLDFLTYLVDGLPKFPYNGRQKGAFCERKGIS